MPPKPENVRGEKLSDFPQRTRLGTSFQVSRPGTLDNEETPLAGNLLPPPTRPVPAIPTSDRKPSYGEEGSWFQSNMDERSQLDPPLPPEPTIVSEGDLMRSSGGPVETSTQSFTEHIPNLTLPLPPPPYSAQRYRVSSTFPPIPKSDQHQDSLVDGFLLLSTSSAEDSQVGAVFLSQQRLKDAVPLPIRNRVPVKWRFYTKSEPGGDAWSVLNEYLTNTSLKSHGRNRALQLLTGYVVSACLENSESGYRLLSQIVRRMRGAERSERDGSIFTLLVNIAAHTSFVRKSSWTAVEGVARRVFSEVVEHMHGRQDDYVMWDRALRCFLVLLKASNHRPSDQISSRCLSALALHVGDFTHTDIEHVLVNEGIYPRLYNLSDDTFGTRVDYACLKEIGGLEAVLTIYADTGSSSVRQSLFRVIYDVAVRICLENTAQGDIDILRDHIVTFRALLEVCDMADCFVHTFRVGPWPSFVLDTARMLLFEPLRWNAIDSLANRTREEFGADDRSVLHEKAESSSISGTRLSGTVGRAYQSSMSRYVSSIRAMVKLLDKQFCLKVIQQLEKMSSDHAARLSRRETTHFAREWKILCDIEFQLQMFIFCGDDEEQWSLNETLTKFYVAAVDITSGRSNVKSVLRLSEMVIDFFAVKVPFSQRMGTVGTSVVDSIPKMFLKGCLLVSRDLLERANPSIFTLLLLATKTKRPSRRLSECRQCLIEFLGSNQKRIRLLRPFTEEEDAAVAYRASELVNKFTDLKEMLPNDVKSASR